MATTDARPGRQESGDVMLGSPSVRREVHPTMAERLSGHDNAIGFLRLLFAGMVVVSHAFPVGGFGADPLGPVTNGQVEIGQFGLFGFFALSGYLIARSAAVYDTLSFLWRRVLRLYPAFLVVLVVGAVVVGPLALLRTPDGLSGYWQGPEGPVGYVVDNSRLAIRRFGIQDVFAQDPYGEANGSVINGSLWTLWYEFQAYLAVGLIAALGLLRRAPWVVPLAALGTFAAIPLYTEEPALRPVVNRLILDQRGLALLGVFLVGAAIAAYSHRVRCRPLLAVVAGATVLVTASTALFVPLGLVAFAYLVLYAGATLPGRVRRVGRDTDISYGVYVYSWPVQALLTTYGLNGAGYLPYLLLTLAVVAVLGYASWQLVEKRALRLKSVGPGRGWAGVPVIGRHLAERPLLAGAAGVVLLVATVAVV